MRASLIIGWMVILTCATAACGSIGKATPITIRWNFRIGDTYVYKTAVEGAGDVRTPFRAEVIEEIEVLDDLGEDRYRIGSKVRQVYVKWGALEWRGGEGRELPKEGVPAEVRTLAERYHTYSAITLTNWGLVLWVKPYESREAAQAEPDLSRPGTPGSTLIPFNLMLLPKAEVIVGNAWSAPGYPLSSRSGSEVVTHRYEGRLLDVHESISDLECRLEVRSEWAEKETESIHSGGLADMDWHVRVRWRNDVGLLGYCLAELKVLDRKGNQSGFRKVVVEVLSIIPKAGK